MFLEGMMGMDMELETPHGIDKCRLMLICMPLLDAKGSTVMDKRLANLKSFIVQQIGRGTTKEEELCMLEALKNYVVSDPQTNERAEAMDYLFNAKFIGTT